MYFSEIRVSKLRVQLTVSASVAFMPLFTVHAHVMIVLIKSNQPCTLCSSDFEITYAISHCIVLHSVQLQ